MADFHTHFPPINARTHEACGPSALSFALSLAGQLGGTVVWLREAWQGDHINPVGFASYLDPQQLLLGLASSHRDLLASAEEALRSGSVALVVMEITKPVGLTEGRRRVGGAGGQRHGSVSCARGDGQQCRANAVVLRTGF